MIKKYNKHKIAPAAWPSITSYVNIAYILLAFVVISINCHRPPCLDHHWWDENTDSCIECTICDEQSVVLRPCQPHRDSVCGTLNDVEYDWNWIVEPDVDQTIQSIERRRESDASKQNNLAMWNWQMAALILVAVACLVFFAVVTYILCQNTKQWRQMKNLEKRFDRDVEELSARLMHTIVDIRSIENGQIMVQEANKDRVFNPLEVRCVYLEQLLVGKDSVKNPGRGNVYIEDANSTK